TLPSMRRTNSNVRAGWDPSQNPTYLFGIIPWGQTCTYIAHEVSHPTWGPTCPGCNTAKPCRGVVQQSPFVEGQDVAGCARSATRGGLRPGACSSAQALRCTPALQLGGGQRGAVVAPSRRGEQVAELGAEAGGVDDIAADRGELVKPDPQRVEGLDVL